MSPSSPQQAAPAPAQAQRLPLPFDDGADDRVPFVLTAAAHREVLGRDVPALVAVAGPVPAAAPRDDASVAGSRAVIVPAAVPEDGSGEGADTRRAQARALLRSGMPVPTIAAALGVEVGAVEGWTSDLVDELARRRRRAARAARIPRTPRPAAPSAAPDLPAVMTPGDAQHARLVPGLALALSQVTDDGVALVHDRAEQVGILLDALRAQLDLAPARVRVAVRLGPDLAADRVCAELARTLGVEAGAITVGRGGAEAPHGLLLRVDVRDPAAARIMRAWVDGEEPAGRQQDSRPAAAS
jgi:hypothetical protein